MFKNIGSPELLVIALVIIVLFGGKKLPEITRGAISAIKEFRAAYKEGEKEPDK
jgi:sec-independent protein translocase protein TatA